MSATNRQVDHAVMKVARFASCPVEVISLHRFTERLVGTAYSQQDCLLAVGRLVAAGRLRRCGAGAFGFIAAA